MKASHTPPIPEAERARKTEALMRSGQTDTARWAEPASLATQWDARAQRAAAHIPANSRVLDVGCGAMALRLALKQGCIYTPSDVVARAPECIVADLNKKEFPAGQYDWVTFLGVVEYIHDPAWPLQQAAKAAPHLLFTYCVDITHGQALHLRRGMGWVNDMDLQGVRDLIGKNGWTLKSETLDKQGPHNHQYMFVCGRM